MLRKDRACCLPPPRDPKFTTNIFIVVHTNGKSQLNVFLEDLSQTFPYFFKGYQNFQIHPFLVTL